MTSLEVAKRAGVSQSAVSRVYTPGASVSAKTAEKVKTAAAELGYRPNVLARAMVSGKSRIIGLVVAYLENYFYPEALEKLSNALQERGYHVLIFMASQTAGNISSVVDEILDYQVDGIVMASVALSSEIGSRCQAAGVPVVLFNRSQDMDDISSVTSDNFEGGARWRIGCVIWDMNALVTSRDGKVPQPNGIVRRASFRGSRPTTKHSLHVRWAISMQIAQKQQRLPCLTNPQMNAPMQFSWPMTTWPLW